MTLTELKAYINEKIVTNGVRAITPTIHNTILNSIVDFLGLAYFDTSVKNTAELISAFDAGSKRIKITASFTLTENVTCPSYCIIDCNSFIITTGGFDFIFTSGTEFIGRIIGNMDFSNNKIISDNLEITGNLTLSGNNINLNNPNITGNFEDKGDSNSTRNARVTGTTTTNLATNTKTLDIIN